MFQSEVCVKFDEQFFPEKLKEITSILRDTEQPFKDIIMIHRLCFVGLYKECKKGPDPFLQFQFQWQKYCSAFLLGSQYAMSEIGLNDFFGYQIGESRAIWLRFCEENEVPVPASNPVMMTIPSALYHCLLDHVNCFSVTVLVPQVLQHRKLMEMMYIFISVVLLYQTCCIFITNISRLAKIVKGISYPRKYRFYTV